jgi:hypothetical protein
VEFVGRGLDKRWDVVDVELLGVLVPAVNQQCSEPNVFGDLKASQNRILQKRSADAPALGALIDPKPGKEQNRYRVRRVPFRRRRSVAVFDTTGGEGVETEYATFALDHEHVGVADDLASPRPLLKPIIDLSGPTLEAAEIVVFS